MIIEPKKYDDTITIESKVIHGVTYTIHHISHGKRSRLRLKLASTLDEIREITDEMDTLIEMVQEPETITGEKTETDGGQVIEVPDLPSTTGLAKIKEEQKILVKIQRLSEKIDLIAANKIDLEYLRMGLVSVNNITHSSGKAYDAELLFESGNEHLCQEVIQAIKAEAGLKAEVKENLELPITSGALADGQTNSTIAPGAKIITFTKGETANDTSQEP